MVPPWNFPCDLPSFNTNGLTLEEAFSKVDEEISQMHERIFMLKAFRNSLAPISQLPTELLSKVFGHLRDGCFESKWDNHAETPFTVTCVCRRWRDIALANPHLWSIITNGVSITSQHIEVAVQRSRNRLLSVSLYNPTTTEFIACLCHISAIRELKVVLSSAGRSCHLQRPIAKGLIQQPAHQLASLYFEKVMVPDHDLTLFSGDLPSLTSVQFHLCHLPFQSTRGRSLLSVPTITRLYISHHLPLVQAATFSETLVSLPNLQELQLDNSLSEDETVRTIPRTSLPSLQTLKIVDVPEPTFHFLEWFDIPGCHIHLFFKSPSDPSSLGDDFDTYQQAMSFDILNFEVRSISEKPFDFILNFSSGDDLQSHRYSLRFACTINMDHDMTSILYGLDLFQVTHLSFLGLPFTSDVVDILSQLENVEVLSTRGSTEDSRAVVELLTPEPLDSDDEDDEINEDYVCFPELKELILDELDDDAYDILLEGLADRDSIGLPSVKLDVKGRNSMSSGSV